VFIVDVMVEKECFSETHETMWWCNPEDCDMKLHCWENLRLQIV